MEFFGGEALILTEFFSVKLILIRGSTHILEGKPTF